MSTFEKNALNELLKAIQCREKIIVKISMKDLTLTGTDAIRYKMFSILKDSDKNEKTFLELLISIGLLQLSDLFTEFSSTKGLPLNFLIQLKNILDVLKKGEKDGQRYRGKGTSN